MASAEALTDKLHEQYGESTSEDTSRAYRERRQRLIELTILKHNVTNDERVERDELETEVGVLGGLIYGNLDNEELSKTFGLARNELTKLEKRGSHDTFHEQRELQIDVNVLGSLLLDRI